LTVGILTGAGGTFCAGVDLKAVRQAGRPSQIRKFFQHGAQKPLLAAVEGAAVAGGLEIALACDMIVAGRGARFGIPEVKVGQLASGGALRRLPMLLPHGVTSELALTGRLMGADEAMSHGLLCRLVDTGQALDCALEIAVGIAANAPLSVAATKRLLREGDGLAADDYWSFLDTVAPAVFASDDAAEGPRAFVERRKPRWTGWPPPVDNTPGSADDTTH
jgi:enoyl-CoA hydratase